MTNCSSAANSDILVGYLRLIEEYSSKKFNNVYGYLQENVSMQLQCLKYQAYFYNSVLSINFLRQNIKLGINLRSFCYLPFLSLYM